MTIGACTRETPEQHQEDEFDDTYYAAHASISSDNSCFTSTDGGGTINFNAEGGSVTVKVDCGTDWTADNTGSDWLDADINVQAGTMTLSVGQNTSEVEKSATVTIKTAAAGIKFATISVNQKVPGAPEISAGSKQWHFPAIGDLTTEISVTCSTDDYTVEVPDEWLAVEKTGSGISIVAQANPAYEERTAKITLTCSNGSSSAFDIITVTQDGLASISFSRQMLLFGTQAGSSSLTVESNFEWDYSYDSTDCWFTISREGDVLTAEAEANESGEQRTGSVLVTAGDGAENMTELSFDVMQSGSGTLIIEYTVSADTQIQLPLAGTVSCAVIWGDDSPVENVSSSAPSHTYAAAGTYDVRIDGTVTVLSSENIGSSSSSCLVGIVQWGKTGLESMDHAFYDCTALASIPDDSTEAFSAVTTFGYAFYGCSSLKALPDGLLSSCSAVTEFKYAFAGCTSLVSLSSGLFANCSAATSFYNTFIYCTSLTSVGDGLFDSCTAAQSFYGVFDACTSLTSVPAGLFAKCTDATDFSYVLYYTGLNEIPTGLFDYNTKATTFIGAFAYCPNIKSVPAGLFAKCPEVTNYYGVFYCCTALETVGEGVFDNCVSAETFEFAFYYCPQLKTLPENMFAYATKATKMTFIFYECTSLALLPKGLFAGCTSVTSMQSVFYKCALESLPEDLFANCTAVTSFMNTFYMCQSLTSIPAGLFDACTLVNRFDYTFYGCTALTAIPSGLFSNCPKAGNFSDTFYYCTSLASLPSNLFENCLNVSSFSNTFFNCSALAGESPYNTVDGKKVHLYERGDYSDVFGRISLSSGCFYGCEGLSDYSSIPDSWKQ